MATHDYAVLGGGCFWCLEAAFNRLPGVTGVISGYAGGETTNPGYEEVCSGSTGHAEVVKIEFNPELITFRQLLEFFWQVHDPTTLNRQGQDRGTQYRSIILYHSPDQLHEATTSRHALDQSGRYPHPSVTEIIPLEKFYPAEEYHQRYFERNPNAGYCRAVIAPKLEKVFSVPGVSAWSSEP
ncbi:peptide-methionine (S)-S-oxide reductase MsrA [Spirochaeta africana]|uniref:Peptide methionine sulfoxide reductase MsrA n=1 Tax=Spirochaeta africana (strain ATCC 700263 / DSM 8902 / Z-7692) TaxID=889378 RepID=H9UJX9_SPIAZ|nr:peptide-methionine (S)-S-oxide reductase MsrA [Spirochaeta africana]AFG37822.1 methionine-S-sulfoxide reductase [Spirochaeta africana DSM 8902]